MKKEKGITLIALIITIIILLILAGITISLVLGEDGIFNKAKQGKEEYSEQAASERLSIALVNLGIDKEIKPTEYNENEYINQYLEKENMIVEGNIVVLEGWKFEIDRSVPVIRANLGRDTSIKISVKADAPISITHGDNKDILSTFFTVKNEIKAPVCKVNGIIVTNTDEIAEKVGINANYQIECIVDDQTARTPIFVENKLYLYKTGKVYTNVVGTIKEETYNEETGLLKFLEDRMNLTKTDKGICYAFTTETIDLTDYKKIKSDYNVLSTVKGGLSPLIAIGAVKTYKEFPSSNNMSARYDPPLGEQALEFDITSFTGEYYLLNAATGSYYDRISTDVYQWYLEK